MKPADSQTTYVTQQSVSVPVRSALVAKLADYLELTKPRIAVLALITVTVGYALAAGENFQIVPLLHALFGVALVAAGSSALNQWVERSIDTRMERTANRPIPSGRLTAGSVLFFGLACGILGSIYLGAFVNTITALAALWTFLLYVFVYTPLKPVTSLCTAVGAIPGALPPVLGWLAASGELNMGAFILFAILFLWQFPHFVAIGWLYREDYLNAGLQMVPSRGESKFAVGIIAVAYALVLLPVSLLPSRFGMAGDAYFLTATILGTGYLLCSIRFALKGTIEATRGLIWSSLVYLPVLLLALTWDHFQLLR